MGLMLLLLLSSCDSGGAGASKDTRSFRFIHTSDSTTFVAATADGDVIEDVEAQLDMSLEARNKFIAGPIARGEGDHNEGYPWHFVEDEWRLTEAAIEVCDGHPEYVSEHVDYFVDEVGQYCPWNALVLEEVDAAE